MVRNRPGDISQLILALEAIRKPFSSIGKVAEDTRYPMAKPLVDYFILRELEGKTPRYSGNSIDAQLTHQPISDQKASTMALNYLLENDTEFKRKFDELVTEYRKKTDMYLVVKPNSDRYYAQGSLMTSALQIMNISGDLEKYVQTSNEFREQLSKRPRSRINDNTAKILIKK